MVLNLTLKNCRRHVAATLPRPGMGGPPLPRTWLPGHDQHTLHSVQPEFVSGKFILSEPRMQVCCWLSICRDQTTRVIESGIDKGVCSQAIELDHHPYQSGVPVSGIRYSIRLADSLLDNDRYLSPRSAAFR